MNVRVLTTIGVAAIGAAWCPGLLAQTPQEVEAWVRRTATDGANFLPPGGIEIGWSIECAPLPRAVFDPWAQQFAGKPKPPELLIEERRIAQGSDTILCKFWYGSPELWRYCSDQPHLSLKYLDEAAHGTTFWSLNAETLALNDADGREFGAFSTSERLTESLEALRLFVSQGLTWATDIAPQEASYRVETKGAEWSADVSSPYGWRTKIDGSWQANAGRIRSVAVWRPRNNGPLPNLEAVVGEIEMDQTLGCLIARRIDWRIDAKPRFYRLTSVAKAAPRRIDELAVAPDPLGKDSVRGTLTLSNINDLRGGLRKSSVRDGDHWNTTASAGIARDSNWLRPAGWAVAASLIIGIVALRIRAARSS